VADYQADAEWSYFTNIQCMPEDESAVDNVHSQSPMANCQKTIRNGQLIILRDGKTYNVMGMEVK
jgi:predicted transcriptional regulator